jgi:Uma2 family endonuclease
MRADRYIVNVDDPRAPPQALWDQMSPEERAEVLASLPSEFPLKAVPEGDPHRIPKTKALEALEEYYRRIRKKIYLSSELPVYYPDEEMFAPDLVAVLDVESHPRSSWVVSHEGRGLDLALEIHVSGRAKKDFEENVTRFSALGIPEYFAFDAVKLRLSGWKLAKTGSKRYEPIVPQGGRWYSAVLDLDLGIEQDRLRFFRGSTRLLDAGELIDELSRMIDGALERARAEAKRAEAEAQRAAAEAQRAEVEAKRAAAEAQRAETEAQRAETEAQRAERLAEYLRKLGVDPDKIE